MPIIKFQRLLNSLEGEPSELLQEISVTGANFQTAWDTLLARYDDKLLRFNAQMNALVNLPPAKQESASHLSTLVNTANTSLNIFKQLALPVEHWDQVLVFHVETKLAPATRLDWAKERDSATDVFTPYKNLLAFLRGRIRMLDRLNPDAEAPNANKIPDARGKQAAKQGKNNQKSNAEDNAPKSTYTHVSLQSPTKERGPVKCPICDDSHYLMKCPQFLAMPVSERKNVVIRQRLCFNCLGRNYSVEKCVSIHRCASCQGKHHSKLHLDRRESPRTHNGNSTDANAGQEGAAAQGQGQTVACLSMGGSNTKIMTTAIVVIESPSGLRYEGRALLDTCSEETYLADHVVDALNLPKQPTCIAISGVGGGSASVSKFRTKFTLKSKIDNSFSQQIDALTLKRLTSILPRTQLTVDNWSYLKDLELADPHCGTPGKIDCLLGVNVFANILRPGLRSGPPNSPAALNTVFGWIIMGGTNPELEAIGNQTQNFRISVDTDLSNALLKFWEVEEPGPSLRFSIEDKKVYDQFHETVQRDDSGRFVVCLPFKEAPVLPNSLKIAIANLQKMEKRFRKHPDLHEAYCKFMTEYAQLQHMELVPEDEVGLSEAYHIPHHPVLKGGDCKKIRVVFNAAATAANGKTLNDTMFPGPNLLLDVRILLLRWRFFRLVFTCDVVKMFRQFLVDPAQRDWHHIVWRESEKEPVQVYRLNTVTYGTVCAPFLANACMQKLAEQEKTAYPLAAQSINKHRYADDFFEGAESAEELIEKADQLIKALATAGMEIGKWATNSPSLLPGNQAKSHLVDLNLASLGSVSTLGLKWEPVYDVFHYEVQVKSTEPTKRSVLSQVARLFDPLVYLAPFIVRGKLLFQALWLAGADWDALIPPAIKNEFIQWREEIKQLEEIQIPRWLQTSKLTTWELHGFCDASERAYAASIYAVVVDDKKRSSHLLYAKSRISPIKVLNIPRLELCGALLLAQMVHLIQTELDLQPARIICWSDSTIVLAWLRGHPSRWKTYVANRVSEILCLIPSASWFHVPSEQNAADCAARGLPVAELIQFELWWQGPTWLVNDSSTWPNQDQAEILTSLEVKRTVNFVATVADLSSWSEWRQNFSSIHKITRILAYISRFIDNLRIPAKERQYDLLSAKELHRGRTLLWRLVQRFHFFEDFRDLQQGRPVRKNSQLQRLDPFIDTEGVIRVGGRLLYSSLTDDERHPIILPTKDHAVTLLMRDFHRLVLHGGPLVTQSVIYRQFWIIKGRNFIRNIVRNCVTCARYAGRTLQQQMAPLPGFRTRPTRPFSCTWVDYAGPFWLKASAGRGRTAYKGWVAIFVCMVTKAVHIEVVGDYTTASFLAAFRRFSNRRGLCALLCSDQGSNFTGADAELKRLFTSTAAFSQEVAAAIQKDGVTWYFVPPGSPNFGGLWEATVKSFKSHLRRTIGERLLTFEEFTTLTCEIEGCLNSRPTSYLGAEDGDVVPLTPGHFLIGAAIVSPPEPFLVENENMDLKSRWKRTSHMYLEFWQCWSQEYLALMQQRPKWRQTQRNIKVNDVVLIKNELQPPKK